MPGVGRNSFKKAKEKAKEKSNPQSLEGPNPMSGKINFNPNTRTAPPDRSPDEVPTKSIFARMTGYFPPTTRMYNSALATPLPQQKPDFLDLDGDGNKTEPMTEAAKSKPLKRPLKGNQDKLPENLKKEILDAPPLARHMKFCGGMSKPYKKK